MHLVLLGVMKHLLTFWIKGNQTVRTFKEDLDAINNTKKNYKATPHEFSRKPRTLDEFEWWKAVEYRSILLYYGPYLSEGHLRRAQFIHFLSLHSAIRILL